MVSVPPDDYSEMSIKLERGERRVQDKFVRQLTDISISVTISIFTAEPFGCAEMWWTCGQREAIAPIGLASSSVMISIASLILIL